MLDLIRARSDRAAAAALEQLEGALSRRVNAIYDRLLGVASNVEAVLDFSDQEIPANVLDPVTDELRAVLAALRELLATWTEGHLLRDGATVVIAGKPNVGKSTLLNALLGRNRAIVSSQPGTTRDTIEETIVLGAYPLVLVDTAGLRETACDIEQEGIRRSQRELADADLCLYVVDATRGIEEEDQQILDRIPEPKRIVVHNKSDLNNIYTNKCSAYIYTTSTTGFGLDTLRSEIVRRLDSGVPHSTQHAVISERHRTLLATAHTQSQSALDGMERSGTQSLDLVAAQLREALESLGSVTGRVYHDQLLDSVFGRFCIGK